MSDNKPSSTASSETRSDTETGGDDEIRPIGAVVITGVLAVIILVLWFGMYLLNIVRS